MAKRDYQEGTYKAGKFRPYQRHGEYNARLDSDSGRDARGLAEKSEIIHGTYKDGVFRPAELSGRKGYAHTVTLAPGKSFGINHIGELYDSQGIAIGRLDEDGKPQFYRLTPKGSHKTKNFGNDIESDEHKRFRDFGLVDGRQIRGYTNQSLTELANYVSRSNKVLGKLRKAQKSYDLQTGVKIRVYEAEIPQFRRDSRGNAIEAGFNAESTDGKEHIVVIDKRLKPYEKIAAVTHELSHVYGGKQIRSEKDLQEEEHDAHLAAINQLSTLYEDYNDLRKATAGTESSFFEVTKQSKRDLGMAVAYLVGTKSYFGVRDEELQRNEQTIRKIKKDLEGRIEAMVGIPAIILSLFFLSSNITGNAIADITNSTTSFFVGLGLLIVGLVAGFLWFKARKSISLFEPRI
jgi:hypothetical protein